MSLEGIGLDRRVDGDDLIGIMATEDFERSRAVARSPAHGIDALHQAFERETWESVDVPLRLVELNNLGATPSQ